jgi:GT2 family glycosyltransferase
MTNKKPLVYVLVLNYCSLDDTIGCVDSTRQSDYTNTRLLVIDNASPDKSGDFLSKIIPDNEYIQLTENIGYAGGNNVGMSYAMKQNADYIFILNPDIRLKSDTISACISLMESDRTIGAINPIQLNPEGTGIDEKFRLGIFDRHQFLAPKAPFSEANQWETMTIYGAALMVSRFTLERTGGFDPLFFAYGEEEDFARRIKRKGLRLVVTSASTVRHLRTKESSVSDHVLFLRLKGSYLYTLKDPSLKFPTAIWTVIKNIISDLCGNRSNNYPFKQFKITSTHIIKTTCWLAFRIFSIKNHRKLEEGAPYLEYLK